MRDPNVRLPQKIGGARRVQEGESQAPITKKQSVPLELIGLVTPEGNPDLKALESAGLLPKFLRLWNNPAILKQLKVVSQLLKTEGVDAKDKAAVKAWADKNEGKLDSGVEPAAPQKPFVATGSTVGRNDPCPCGSKKKFKKCCEGK